MQSSDNCQQRRKLKTNTVKWFTIAVIYLKSNKSTREPDYNTSLISNGNRKTTV